MRIGLLVVALPVAAVGGLWWQYTNPSRLDNARLNVLEADPLARELPAGALDVRRSRNVGGQPEQMRVQPSSRVVYLLRTDPVVAARAGSDAARAAGWLVGPLNCRFGGVDLAAAKRLADVDASARVLVRAAAGDGRTVEVQIELFAPRTGVDNDRGDFSLRFPAADRPCPG